MADREKLMTALRNAHAAGDEAAAKRIAGMIKALPEEKPGLGDILYENVIGRGKADTPGERLGQLIRGGGAALARGIADVPALPANIAQLGVMGAEKALGMDSSAAGRALEALPDTREMLASVPVIGPESAYRAPGTAGEYISTVGEFMGGAGAMAGPNAMLRYGAVPGVASETAGQLTEGTAAEPYARLGAGLLAGIAATPRPERVGGMVRRADEETADAAARLQRQGVRPTAGQVLDAENLMKVEGAAGPSSEQLEAFTRAALRTAGNTTAKRATPSVLRQTERKITQGMNDILSSVDVPISSGLSGRVAQVSDDYFVGTAGRDMPVAIRKIAEQLENAVTSPTPTPIPATTLRKWRTTLGSYTTSSQEMTREAAKALRGVIDDATEDALRASGRAGDIDDLAKLRTEYRNFLTIADASTRGGREGARGIITPERLDTAAKRTLGRRQVATGGGTDIAQLSRDALSVIGSAPTVTAGGVRDVLTGGATAAGLGGAGAYGGFAAGGVPGAIAGGLAGAMAPVVGQSLMRSGPVQSALMDPRQFANVGYALPGLLSAIE